MDFSSVLPPREGPETSCCLTLIALRVCEHKGACHVRVRMTLERAGESGKTVRPDALP
jgi:hypothetical protein